MRFLRKKGDNSVRPILLRWGRELAFTIQTSVKSVSFQQISFKLCNFPYFKAIVFFCRVDVLSLLILAFFKSWKHHGKEYKKMRGHVEFLSDFRSSARIYTWCITKGKQLEILDPSCDIIYQLYPGLYKNNFTIELWHKIREWHRFNFGKSCIGYEWCSRTLGTNL